MNKKIKMVRSEETGKVVNDEELENVTGGGGQSYYDGAFAGFHAQCYCPVHKYFLITKDDLAYLAANGYKCPGDGKKPCGMQLKVRTDPKQSW